MVIRAISNQLYLSSSYIILFLGILLTDCHIHFGMFKMLCELLLQFASKIWYEKEVCGCFLQYSILVYSSPQYYDEDIFYLALS